MGNENTRRLTLNQRIKIQEEMNALTQPVTGKWLLLNPAEAVIEAIRSVCYPVISSHIIPHFGEVICMN